MTKKNMLIKFFQKQQEYDKTGNLIIYWYRQSMYNDVFHTLNIEYFNDLQSLQKFLNKFNDKLKGEQEYLKIWIKSYHWQSYEEKIYQELMNMQIEDLVKGVTRFD